MKRVVKYNAVFVYNSEGISVVFPACKGCITYGKSDSQAKLMAADALRIWCSVVLDNGILLPPELSLLELNNWIKENKKNWGKSKWTVKLIKVCLEGY